MIQSVELPVILIIWKKFNWKLKGGHYAALVGLNFLNNLTVSVSRLSDPAMMTPWNLQIEDLHIP